MSPRLLQTCVLLWLLGIAGSWIARALFELEPHELPCRASALAFLLGGIGYTGFGLACLTTRRLRGADLRSQDPLPSARLPER